VNTKLSIKDPSGKNFAVASAQISRNKPYASPIVKFSKPGTYVVTLVVGTVKKVVTVKVSA
jgi:hypothetical protein